MGSIKQEPYDKPSTGATIPRSGFLNKLEQYVERVVGSKYYSGFFLQGFIFTFFKLMPTIFGSFLRGKIYRIVLGNLGNSVLIEKNVTLNIPKRIFLGDRVVIGESSVIDPRGAYGRIIIKNDIHIQRWCRLTTGGSKELPGELIIEDSVYIGPYSYIHAAFPFGSSWCMLLKAYQCLTSSSNFTLISPKIEDRMENRLRKPTDELFISVSTCAKQAIQLNLTGHSVDWYKNGSERQPVR